MNAPKVVVIGDACVDMVIRLPDRTSGTPDGYEARQSIFLNI